MVLRIRLHICIVTAPQRNFLKTPQLTGRMASMAEGTRPRSLSEVLLSSGVKGLCCTVEASVKVEKGSAIFCSMYCRTSLRGASAGNWDMVEDPSGRRNFNLDILLRGKVVWVLLFCILIRRNICMDWT